MTTPSRLVTRDQAITASTARQNVVGRTGSDIYANLEYAAFGLDARLVIDEKRRFQRVNAPTMINASCIGFVDALDPQVKDRLYDNSMPWVLVPDVTNRVDFEYRNSRDIRRARLARKLPPKRKAQPNYFDENAPFNASLLFGEPSLALLFDLTLQSHPFVCNWKDGRGSYFNRTKLKGATRSSQLGFVYPSPGCIMVRPASETRWVHCPMGYAADVIKSARDKKLKWEEFLLWLLFCVDSNYLSWYHWWSEKFPEFNKVADRLSNCYEQMLDAFRDGSKYDVDDDEETATLAAWTKARLEATHGSVSREGILEKEINWFIDNVLPGLNLQFMRNAATPWDKKLWDSGQIR